MATFIKLTFREIATLKKVLEAVDRSDCFVVEIPMQDRAEWLRLMAIFRQADAIGRTFHIPAIVEAKPDEPKSEPS